jgi:hypothetical protein
VYVAILHLGQSGFLRFAVGFVENWQSQPEKIWQCRFILDIVPAFPYLEIIKGTSGPEGRLNKKERRRNALL